jgi:hypothetical protein
MEHGFATPEEVREAAVVFADCVENGEVDDVLYLAQQLETATQRLYAYQESVRRDNVNKLIGAVSLETKTRILAHAILDAIDVGDYGNADGFLHQFRRDYDCLLGLMKATQRARGTYE